MKKLLAIAAISTSLAGFGSAGWAADPYIDPPYDWSGPYFGIFGGYAFGNSDATDGGPDFFDDTPPAGLTFGLNPDGFVAGADLGYNWQVNSLVFGIEAEAAYNDASDSSSIFVADGANGLLDDDFATSDFGFQAALSGRLGFAADRILFYGKGGLAIADVDQSAGDLDAGAVDPTDIASSSKTLMGFLVGGGIEYAVNDSWSGFIEYNYVDLENTKATNLDGDTARFKNNMSVIKAGINFHF
jgi:outer membrane immunogenic protein